MLALQSLAVNLSKCGTTCIVCMCIDSLSYTTRCCHVAAWSCLRKLQSHTYAHSYACISDDTVLRSETWAVLSIHQFPFNMLIITSEYPSRQQCIRDSNQIKPKTIVLYTEDISTWKVLETWAVLSIHQFPFNLLIITSEYPSRQQCIRDSNQIKTKTIVL